LQAYALLAAAHGAVDAFAELTGSDWKAYQASQPAGRTLDRMAAQAELLRRPLNPAGAGSFRTSPSFL